MFETVRHSKWIGLIFPSLLSIVSLSGLFELAFPQSGNAMASLDLLRPLPIRVGITLAIMLNFLLLEIWWQRGRKQPASSPGRTWIYCLMLILAIKSIGHRETNVVDHSAWLLMTEIALSTLVVAAFSRHSNQTHALATFWSTLAIFLGLMGMFPRYNHSPFIYHETVRAVGIWGNPNMFGILMCVGFIGSMGLLLARASSSFTCQKERRKLEFWPSFSGILNVFTGIICANALIKSLSRGAFAALTGGMIVLAFGSWRVFKYYVPRKTIAKQDNYNLPILILGATGLLLFVLGVHLPLLHRVTSVFNSNDFSWGNRVSSYGPALRIMMLSPLFGIGFDLPEKLYIQYYADPRIIESAAIQMNDYLMLGMASGIPALVVALLYITEVLKGQKFMFQCETYSELSMFSPEMVKLKLLRLSCKSAAVALLIGFFLDGGLFRIETGLLAWTLLGLIPD